LTNKKGILRAISISKEKGTSKTPIERATLIKAWGIDGDAHAGKWHRQVSLLSYERIEELKKSGAITGVGSFAENLAVEGIDLPSLPVGTHIKIGSSELEITQIGKACHSKCEIYKLNGDCIMPREGIFARVLTGGEIAVGDELSVILPSPDRAFTAAVVTMSDKAYSGEREDASTPLAVQMLTESGYIVEETVLLPDEQPLIERELKRLADQRQISLIVTTGGTGFSQRDVTPEATINVCERMARGVAEAIRANSMTITPRAMLSRAESGIRGKSLIINLPGSPKAVKESLEFVLPNIEHGLAVLRGNVVECSKDN
jgi:molybdenum cofactor synthesis domain-containing protein